MQNGNGSASPASHSTSVIFSFVSGSARSLASAFLAFARLSRTACARAGSASSGVPLSEPRIARKTSTMPGARSGKCPRSVAFVAPAGRQHSRDDQV